MARNITKQEPMPLTMAHYLRNMSRLTDQYFEKQDNYRDKDRQRIYLKDIDPPSVWTDKLKEQIPPNLFYLNDCTGEVGGPGADDEKISGGGMRRGRGIAPAGDLMSSLPPSMRAENLQCYIGHEGTYTPTHREMCATLGHNIMVENSNLLGDDGKPEKPGSSIWFMTETKDRQTVAEYWLSILGHDIEVEKHFAQIAAWKKAPFTVYVCEQKAGDFLLIPPLAPHQVWNRGTRTMKVAWNRTTVETLELAMQEALPKARMVCRDEQYKNKSIVYYTLQKYANLLDKARDRVRTAPSPEEQNTLRNSPKIRQLKKDFKRLFHLFKDIILSEMFAPGTNERNMQFLLFDSNVTCAYCRGNIFNRFLTCPHCETALGTEQPEPYDICMECYAMGRSCGCISKLRWVEQFKWKDLVTQYEVWRRAYLDIDNGNMTEASPLPLAEERQRYRQNTLAQICQYQLKRRPWIDIFKPPSESEGSEGENEQIEYAEDGSVKKRKRRKKRTETWLKNNKPCHVCAHRHPRWKMAECTCGRNWCYGTLFRGHDIMPQEVMADPAWRCPHCQGICSAGNCRKDPRQTPHEPKGTLLGHDTRAVADFRSVESLVDFSVSNLNWLKETTQTPVENARLRRKQHEAEISKLNDTELNGHHYATEEDAFDGLGDRSGIEYDNPAIDSHTAIVPIEDATIIDPSLLADQPSRGNNYNLLRKPSNGISVNDDEHHFYASTQDNGLVAPSAVMYSASTDAASGDIDSPARNGQKQKFTADELAAAEARPQGKMCRRETDPVSGATKQYRRDHEKRALEEARRKGRFIQVSAALKGKKKIIKLRISSDRLQHLRDAVQELSNEIVASDVQPRNSRSISFPSATSTITTAKTKPKAVLIRTERDEDFATRRRGRKRKINDVRRRNVEEIDVPSDPADDDEVFGEQQAEGALDFAGGHKRRRISQWQARRAAKDNGSGDTDEECRGAEVTQRQKAQTQQELHHSRADGAQSTPRKRLKPSRPLIKTAGKSVPGLRPSRKSLAMTTRTAEAAVPFSISPDSPSGEEEQANSGMEVLDVTTNMVQTTASAEEEDRKAKLEAGGLHRGVNEADHEPDHESDDGSLFVKDVVTSPKPEARSVLTAEHRKSLQGVDVPIRGIRAAHDGEQRPESKSILAKRGEVGGKRKRIRIVSAQKKNA